MELHWYFSYIFWNYRIFKKFLQYTRSFFSSKRCCVFPLKLCIPLSQFMKGNEIHHNFTVNFSNRSFTEKIGPITRLCQTAHHTLSLKRWRNVCSKTWEYFWTKTNSFGHWCNPMVEIKLFSVKVSGYHQPAIILLFYC